MMFYRIKKGIQQNKFDFACVDWVSEKTKEEKNKAPAIYTQFLK